jgi:hypothetical protein
MAECEHLIERRDCADCRPGPGVPAAVPALYGPWFIAGYDGTCALCSDDFYEGDEIRSDGGGGWLARCCGGDDVMITRKPRPAPSPDPGGTLLEQFAAGTLDFGKGYRP